MEKQKITVEELSVLMWLKLLQDFEEIAMIALVDKIEVFQIDTTDIEPEFFYETVEKFRNMGIMTDDSLSEDAYKCAELLLGMENAKIKITTSFKEIVQFIKDNRNDIYNILSITIAFLELVS